MWCITRWLLDPIKRLINRIYVQNKLKLRWAIYVRHRPHVYLMQLFASLVLFAILLHVSPTATLGYSYYTTTHATYCVPGAKPFGSERPSWEGLDLSENQLSIEWKTIFAQLYKPYIRFDSSERYFPAGHDFIGNASKFQKVIPVNNFYDHFKYGFVLYRSEFDVKVDFSNFECIQHNISVDMNDDYQISTLMAHNVTHCQDICAADEICLFFRFDHNNNRCTLQTRAYAGINVTDYHATNTTNITSGVYTCDNLSPYLIMNASIDRAVANDSLKNDSRAYKESDYFISDIKPESLGGKPIDKLNEAPLYFSYKYTPPNNDYPDGMITIYYLFLYPYNGPTFFIPFIPIGAHLLDIEGIQVQINPSTGAMVGVYFNRHDLEMQHYDIENVQCHNDFHPTVYSARYGHASYAYPGPQIRFFDFGSDRCDGKGGYWYADETIYLDDNLTHLKEKNYFYGHYIRTHGVNSLIQHI